MKQRIHCCRIFSFLMIMILQWSTLYAAEKPIQLEGGAFFIDHLPINLSGNWKICPQPLSPLLRHTPHCVPITHSEIHALTAGQPVILQMELIIDESLKSMTSGLIIRELQGADELYLNGSLIGKTGSFPPRYESASFYIRHYVIPYDLLKFNTLNLIQLHLYNQSSYQYLEKIDIQISPLNLVIQSISLTEIFYISIVSLLLLVAFFKLYCFIRIPTRYETLALSAFCLFSALAVLLNSHLLLMFGFDSNSFLRWMSVFFVFSQLAFTYFLFNLFEVTNQLIRRFVVSGYILFGITILVWPLINILEGFYNGSKILALIVPIIVVVSTSNFRRQRMNNEQLSMLVVIILFAGSVLFEFLRDYLLWFEHNTVMIFGLVLLALWSSLISTEQIWTFFKGATYDHLTGTLRKPSFFKRLSEEMQRCRRSEFCLLVAVIDLDHFRTINQNYGLEVGDRSLIIISATLTRVLRQFDLICRIHDDEFCVAATLPNDENTLVFVQRLHEEINAATVSLDEQHKFNLQATTGAVLYNPDRHTSPEMLLHDAEHSVTEAKMRQRGSIVWFDIENPPLQFVF